jgi:hypothetical protein
MDLTCPKWYIGECTIIGGFAGVMNVVDLGVMALLQKSISAKV